MARIVANSEEAKRVDLALAAWRQGDVALRERWFIHAGDPGCALTPAANETAEPGLQAITSEVDGLLVLTQTCDIVRGCISHSFLEVCPLIVVDRERLQSIRRGQRPNLAYVPSLSERGLVGVLDRVMTVEKSVVAGWDRAAGCTTDEEVRAFAQALARKRNRMAFPNEFTAFVERLRRRMIDKHGKQTQEGKALRALREIRVAASPDWNAETIELMFWFIRNEDDLTFEGVSWDKLLSDWLALVPAEGCFVQVFGSVTSLSDLTADDYVNSDPLDLDYLSSGG